MTEQGLDIFDVNPALKQVAGTGDIIIVQMDSLRYTQAGRIHGSDDRLMFKIISCFNDCIDFLRRKHGWKIPLTLHGRKYLMLLQYSCMIRSLRLRFSVALRMDSKISS